ncbi:MAG: methyltransferase domain-containing protein, partial [Chloroflexota bacterium]
MTDISPLPVNDTDDLLWKHLKTIPAFRGILRAVEARFYQQIEMPHPILDVGCGDGHFAQVTFDEQIDVGIDPWWGPLQHSKRNNTYALLLQSLGNELPFPDEHFASALSNSVLEHIPDIQAVLNETGRVLQKNGRFVITMPCHHFNDYLGGVSWFRKIGADGLADRYESLATRITRHVHVNKPEVWAERLAQAGMEIERWQYYFSPGAVQALEIGHVQGVPSALIRALTGHWIIAPWEESLARTERWLRPFYEEETAVSEGAYIFIVARKVANHPINAPLPEPNPFPIAELMHAESIRLAGKAPEEFSQPIVSEISQPLENEVVSYYQTPTLETDAEIAEEENHASRGNLFNYSILVASLFLGVIGQLIISGSPEETGRGLGWFVLAGLALFLIGFQQGFFSLPALPNFSLPTIQSTSRQRWLILPAILLSLFARSFVSGNGAQRPFLAFIFWFAAIGLAIFSLRRQPDFLASDSDPPGNQSTTLYYALLFFGVAFSIRIFDLTTHPFMLNGIETSLGLDALNVIRGSLSNPFGVGWLTNPTLPSFISAIPIRIFGPTTFSLRILSPFIGALTVTAVFIIAKKLWNETVALVAAILLTGSHFHIHYSRLGMTNVWDAL